MKHLLSLLQVINMNGIIQHLMLSDNVYWQLHV
jgi:hypothetical protein